MIAQNILDITNLANKIAHLLEDEYEHVKKLAIMVLGLLDPKKPMGTELFDAIAQVTVTVAYETICFKEVDGELYVYLVQRDQTDTAYPGQWHVPGSVLRPGETQADVMARLSKKEYGAQITDYYFISNFNSIGEERGHFFTPYGIVKLESEPTNPAGKWFFIKDLPENTVLGHREAIIPMAVTAYYKLQQVVK